MFGLILAKEFYLEYGAKMIKEKFSDYKDRISVGLVGEGSECFGFDDDLSRDHDWGPGFCLWLTTEDYKVIGKKLQDEYKNLPKSFKNFKRFSGQWSNSRVGVSEIGNFYQKFTGCSKVPETLEKWLYIPEEYLSNCTNGEVFVDPLGEFTKTRNALLSFYPEDIRLSKIAGRCMSCAQTGQYNFIRSVSRKEYFSALYAETKFCSDIMSLVFLLNRRYAPFYKWRHKAVQSLPILGKFLHEKIDCIVSLPDYSKKSEIIETICCRVIDELQNQGLSFSNSKFLLDHGPLVQKNIVNKDLKERDVWFG